MYPSPLAAFFFPYWGFLPVKTGGSAPEERARTMADCPNDEVAHSAPRSAATVWPPALADLAPFTSRRP
jgi:hypothetical protein